MNIPHVVIVGGGFAGLAAAKGLACQNIAVTLIDKRNYHLFLPLLYQVAMAGLSPAEIAYPLRSLLSHSPHVKVLLGETIEINKEEKWIRTESNIIKFDYLILACGSTYTYFNHPNWEAFAPGLKTIQQATEIRRKVFLAFEKAERETDKIIQARHLTFVIVGGGPTGVELAGSLGEITRFSLNQDFDQISPDKTKIILLEAGPRILPSMSPHLSEEAMHELQDFGVEVMLNSKVSNINEKGILVNEKFIYSSTILWAAGVAANPLNKKLNVPLDGQGRIIVQRNLSIQGHSNIFVVGDQAHYKWGLDQKPLPGLAPVAMQQGRFVAKIIKARVFHRKEALLFKYIDKGQMATIGRSKAVAMFRGLEFHGFIAWMAWLLVHIYYLIGFKNRLFVLFQWAWTYLTFRRGARLIVDKE